MSTNENPSLSRHMTGRLKHKLRCFDMHSLVTEAIASMDIPHWWLWLEIRPRLRQGRSLPFYLVSVLSQPASYAWRMQIDPRHQLDKHL